MIYPINCFTDLVGIKGVCEPKANPFYWLEDIPGIDIKTLAKIADVENSTGQKVGEQLIESAARMLIADIESIYDSNYKVVNVLVNECSHCVFTNNYTLATAGTERGVLIVNNILSKFSSLYINKLVVKINNTGVFNIIITDDQVIKTIPFEFTAGVEYEINNINYESKRKRVRIFFNESVQLADLGCKSKNSGCGCSGTVNSVERLIYTGTINSVEHLKMYGFIPCALIKCDASDLLCYLSNSAPRMVGMALLYKIAELYFTTSILSSRNNKVAGTGGEEKKTEADKYAEKYINKLNGVGTRGIKDTVFTLLKNTQDICVVCDSLNSVSWATG